MMRQTPRAPADTATQVLRAAFDGAPDYTVGAEEEVMLLSPHELELVARAPEVIELVAGDPRFKLELPASQVEIVTPPLAGVEALASALRDGRRDLSARCDGIALLAAAGTHPFSAGIGEVNRTPRYEPLIRQYGGIAARQLVCALQVHVAVPGADRALSLYNSLRSYLPLLAALAANAPFYEGIDTGFASVRPKLAELLPRQGIPPAFGSWGSYARALRWDGGPDTFPELRSWWWELRPHPRFGTLELRVPDAQSTVEDAVAIAGVIHCLVRWLGERYDSGEALPVAPSWLIAENRWSAARHGVAGSMAEPDTCERRSTRSCLYRLLDDLLPSAQRLGASRAIEHARGLVHANGAILQRRAAAGGGARAAARWLVERFRH